MPNALRTKMQSIINAVARKVGKTGYYNPSSIESDIEGILTDVNANNMIGFLISGQNIPTTITIPEGITLIRSNAIPFANQSNKVIIPSSVTEIKANSFINSVGYNSAKLDMFYNGSIASFLNVKKGEDTGYATRTTISNRGYYLYINNERIDDLTLDYSINIPSLALSDIYLNSLRITKNVSGVSRHFFDGYAKEIIFDEDSPITILPTYAFSGLGSTDEYVSFKLPKNLLEIEPYCFQQSYIKELILPEGLTTIGDNAFKDFKLKNLTISIPSSVKNLGSYCFHGLKGLTVIFNSDTPPTLASASAFTTTNLKIYVPSGKLDIYKTATNYTSYASYMIEKNIITLSVPSGLLNNENYLYQVNNDGKWLQFNGSSITLNEVGNLKFKNTDANVTIKIGATNGGSEIGTIANAETSYNTAGSISIYLTIQ